MKNQKRTIPYSLGPGLKLPDDIKNALKAANKEYQRSRNFNKYTKKIQEILNLPDYVPFTEQEKCLFGGFVEGEGSISVSAKKGASSKFGVYFDPEFSVTQHVNGSIHLFRCLCYFRTGLIRYKNKSNATFVYTIDNRESLKAKIVPFMKKYVIPYSCTSKELRFQCWCRLLELFEEGAHSDLKRFLNEIGPLWDQLRMQKGQSNETFASLEDFQRYVINYVKAKEAERRSDS